MNCLRIKREIFMSQQIEKVFIKFLLKSYVKFLALSEPPHTLTNLEFDDERYALSNFSLPQC